MSATVARFEGSRSGPSDLVSSKKPQLLEYRNRPALYVCQTPQE